MTVVIPVKDRRELLSAALRSVREQVLAPAEVIVIDDGSSDGSGDIAHELGALVLTNEAPQGSGVARNRGLAQARTPWVAFLDSDDEWEPQHLHRLVEHADGADLVTASALSLPSRRVLGRVQPWPRELRPRDLFWPESQVCTSGTMVRVEAAEAAGGFRSLARAQDLDLWVRLLLRGRGVATGHVTVRYREHAGQTTHVAAPSVTMANRILDEHEGAPWLDVSLRRDVRLRRAWDAGDRGCWRTAGPRGAAGIAGLLAYRRAAHLRGRLASVSSHLSAHPPSA